VRKARIADFDVESWIGLTFGTDFLDLNHYYGPGVARPNKDPLIKTVRCWESARRPVGIPRWVPA
jgi:hypothetical protein